MYFNGENVMQPSIKKYDFRSPKKFGKEQLRTIESLHENLGRNLTTYLTTLTRVYSEVEVVSVEEQRYFEYSNNLNETIIMTNYDLVPLDDTIDDTLMIFTLNQDIGFFLIDKLLGGSGEGFNYKRDFTQIELAVFDNFFSNFNWPIELSWNKYLEIETRFKSIETNSRVAQVLAPEDIVVVIKYNIKIGNLTSEMSICLPAISLENLMEKFTPKFIRTVKRPGVEKEEIQKNAILGSLKSADIELKVTLDEIELDLNDILQLEVNDIIPLSKRYDSNVTLSVNDNPWFEAKLGETKLRKAVKIDSLIEKER